MLAETSGMSDRYNRQTHQGAQVILHFNYEELSALRAGAHVFLEGGETERGGVLAPPEARARVEALVPLLEGDISLSTLEELRSIETAVVAISDRLRVEMESVVVATHAADEYAVASYFDFAHAFTVAHRLGEMASEMEALIELMTGSPLTDEAVASFNFSD